MEPFFSYDFYNFDQFRSSTVRGSNPLFDSTQRYEVDYTSDMLDYFKYETLRIDFIDESVDLRANNEVDDYIGSARVKLSDLLETEMKEYKLPIKNAKGMQTGIVEVNISFLNYIQMNQMTKGLNQMTG